MTEVKPRLTYAQFLETQDMTFPKDAKLADFEPYTLSWWIQRFIERMNGWAGKPPVRELGSTHLLGLRALQRRPISRKNAARLKKQDIIKHAELRIANGVKPQTVGQDLTFLRGVLKYVPSDPDWTDGEDVSDACITAALPYLQKHNLVSKSQPRSRRPTDEEIDRLIAYYEKQKEHPRTKLDMVLITKWQRASSRRISETCRLMWGDWDKESRTILVRKMKDPRNRNKDKLVALPEEAQAMLLELEPKRLRPNDPTERIFPFCSKSCSASYTKAKKAIGIDGLHLHDSRRDCGSKLVEEDGYTPAEAIQVTGHETVQVFERTYLCMNPKLLKDGPLSRRQAAAPSKNS